MISSDITNGINFPKGKLFYEQGENMSKNLHDTIKFCKQEEKVSTPRDVLEYVYTAMNEKGYDSVDQLVGYFLSGDPTYITSHANARTIICKRDRYDLIEELVRSYIDNNLKKGSKKFR